MKQRVRKKDRTVLCWKEDETASQAGKISVRRGRAAGALVCLLAASLLAGPKVMAQQQQATPPAEQAPGLGAPEPPASPAPQQAVPAAPAQQPAAGATAQQLPAGAPAGAPAAEAPAPQGPPVNIALHLENADLLQVIGIIAAELEMNYVVDPQVKGTVNINTLGELRRDD